jgi:CRP-like cAMP-binding protein
MGSLFRALARFRLSDPESASTPAVLCGLEADTLLQAGQARAVPAHTLLCQEGRTTDRFFVVTAGLVEIAKDFGGKPRALSTLGPGSILALMAALDGGPCAVSMRTLSDATVVEITRCSLLALFDPEQATVSSLAHDLTLVAIRRLRGATDALAHTLFQALQSSPRAGRIDAGSLARIQASDHAWPCVRLAA